MNRYKGWELLKLIDEDRLSKNAILKTNIGVEYIFDGSYILSPQYSIKIDLYDLINYTFEIVSGEIY